MDIEPGPGPKLTIGLTYCIWFNLFFGSLQYLHFQYLKFTMNLARSYSLNHWCNLIIMACINIECCQLFRMNEGLFCSSSIVSTQDIMEMKNNTVSSPLKSYIIFRSSVLWIEKFTVSFLFKIFVLRSTFPYWWNCVSALWTSYFLYLTPCFKFTEKRSSYSK